jgi:hypothetical protein
MGRKATSGRLCSCSCFRLRSLLQLAADKGRASSDKLCSNPGGGVLEYWCVGRARNASHSDAGDCTALLSELHPANAGLMVLSG